MRICDALKYDLSFIYWVLLFYFYEMIVKFIDPSHWYIWLKKSLSKYG